MALSTKIILPFVTVALIAAMSRPFRKPAPVLDQVANFISADVGQSTE
jgi:hypothetical protein